MKTEIPREKYHGLTHEYRFNKKIKLLSIFVPANKIGDLVNRKTDVKK